MRLVQWMIWFSCAGICSVHAAPTASASDAPTPKDSVEVVALKRKVLALTGELEALWVYVESGPDNPNIHAFNRAMAFYEKRRLWKKK